MKVSFCKQEKKRALGRAWVLLRVLEITRQKFPRKKSRDISNFLRYLKTFMYFIHVFSRNRKRCSAEPRLESTALDDSGRTTVGSSRGNCQYLYTAEIASTCTPRKLPVPVHRGKNFLRSLLFTVQPLYKKSDFLLNLNLTNLTLKQRSILVINKQLFMLSVCQ